MNIRRIAEKFAKRHVMECELIEEFMPIPVIPYAGDDEELHTDDHPFCGDLACPCRYDQEQYGTAIDQPYTDGLMTLSEGSALFRGRNI